MRKSTVVAIGILVFAFIAMLWLFRSYTQEFIVEIRHAKELTDELKPRLAPGTRVKLARMRGASRYLVADDAKFGLLVDVSPSRESFEADAAGRGISEEIAARAFEIYGPDRPIDWVEVRVRRLDDKVEKPMGFLRVEGGGIEPIPGTVPPAPGATPPPPVKPPAAAPAPGAPQPPGEPGMSAPGAAPSPPAPPSQPGAPTVPPAMEGAPPEGPPPTPAPAPAMEPGNTDGSGMG